MYVNNQKNIRRGFTLIELLVVIAIIGVLSAVVLASLNTARSKGTDAAVKSNLVQIRTQAEIFYGGNSNSYGTQVWATTAATCNTVGSMFANTNVARSLAAADSANGGTNNVGCASTASTYVVAAALVETANTYWCADSSGVSKQVNAAFPGAIASCP